jgi:hypothetical protein
MAVGEPLVNFLEACPDTQVTLTFEEVEQILGVPLPPTARQFSPWWHGVSWHTRRWQDLGWRVTCSYAAGTVTFTKNHAG